MLLFHFKSYCLYHLFCVYVCAMLYNLGACGSLSSLMGITAQFVGISSLPPPCGCQLNLGLHSEYHAHLSTKQSCQIHKYCSYIICFICIIKYNNVISHFVFLLPNLPYRPLCSLLKST